MNKILLNSSIIGLALMFCALFLFGCNSYSINDKEYWFSSFEKSFVAYDETLNNEQGNIDEAGTYWKITVRNNCNITIKFRDDTDKMYSATYCSLNGKQVKSEVDSFYDYAYKNLSLKSGDKIEIHAFWTNALMTNQKGFTIDLFSITNSKGEFPINNIE